MHRCEEFRERITGHIIDREDVAGMDEFRVELLMCSGCSEFYLQSRELMDTLDHVEFSISHSEWARIEMRLQNTLEAVCPRRPARLRRWTAIRRPYRWWPAFATAALLLLIIGLYRAPVPAGVPLKAVYVEHLFPLDPVTVDFLDESESLLRNVMTMAPTNVADLEGAKKVANEQLAELGQRKQAAADVPPVVSVMETYETILRDLRNVDERTADEDITDIQQRIRQNGLIANIKAFQPKLTEVRFDAR
jgi:hypothetical protein